MSSIWVDKSRQLFIGIGCAVLFDRVQLAIEEAFVHRVPRDDSIDYVIEFAPDAPDSRKRSILTRLIGLGLDIEQLEGSFWNETGSTATSVYAVHAPFAVLMAQAEAMDLKKIARTTGELTRFTVTKASKFVGFNNPLDFFSPTERERIVLHTMLSLSGNDSEDEVTSALRTKVITQIFPLSDSTRAATVLKEWSVRPDDMKSLKLVNDYFGSEIAFSFAWLALYTKFLWLPAIFGVFTYMNATRGVSGPYTVVFSASTSIMATVFLELWKRRSSRLKYEFGVQDLESFARHRAGFNPAPLHIGPLTLSVSMRRTIITISTIPIMGALLGLTAACMFASFEATAYMKTHHANNMILLQLPAVVFGLVLKFLNELYGMVAERMTKWENHRTEAAHNYQLILRGILLKCTSSFMSLFYLTFWVQDMERVRAQLAALLITSQVVGQLQEIGMPLIMGLVRASRSKKTVTEIKRDREALKCAALTTPSKQVSPAGLRIVPCVEADSVKEVYDNTIADFTEMILQFGYVFLFGWSWPLAALCALLNNITELRTDCFKLCMVHQKPRGTAANGIGAWYYVLQTLSVCSVFVNTAYLVIHIINHPHSFLPEYTVVAKLSAVILLEHVVFALKLLLDYAIDDAPGDIRDRISAEQKQFALQKTDLLVSPATSIHL